MACKTDVQKLAQLPDDVLATDSFKAVDQGEAMRLEYPATETGSSSAGNGPVQITVLSLNWIVIPIGNRMGVGCDASKRNDLIDQTHDDGWWKCEKAAAYLGFSPKAVREGAFKGTLPGHKYPANSKRGRWRFKRDELDGWLSKKPTVRKTKGATVW